jgi:hypothetical protein
MRFLCVAAAAVALAGSFALFEGTARASATCDNPTSSSCIDADTFWPAPGPARFPSVGNADTTARGSFSASLVVSVASHPLIFAIPSPGGTGSESVAINTLATATALFSYGVTRALQLDLAVPVTVFQSGGGLSALTGGDSLAPVALRDLRFGFSLGLLGAPGALLEAAPTAEAPYRLAFRFAMTAPTGDESQLAGESGAVWAPALVNRFHLGRFDAGVDVGARIRNVAHLASAAVGTQLSLGLAAGYDVLAERGLLQVGAEARALPTLAAQGSGGVSPLVPAEWSVGVRSTPLAQKDIAFDLSGGGGLPLTGETGATTPRLRFVLGVRYTPSGALL